MSLLLVKTREAYLPTILFIPEKGRRRYAPERKSTQREYQSVKTNMQIICITCNPDVLEKETELRSIRLVLLVHLLEDRRIWSGPQAKGRPGNSLRGLSARPAALY